MRFVWMSLERCSYDLFKLELKGSCYILRSSVRISGFRGVMGRLQAMTEEDAFCIDVNRCHLRGVHMVHLNLSLKEAVTFEIK